MERESSPAHPPPEGGEESMQLLWPLPHDMNAHAVLQTKGENEHGSGASTIGSSSSMDEPRGEEEPGGGSPRGPQEDPAGQTGTRGRARQLLGREAPQLSHNGCEEKCHMPVRSHGRLDPLTDEQACSELLLGQDRSPPSHLRPPEHTAPCPGAGQVPFPATQDLSSLVLDSLSVLALHDDSAEDEALDSGLPSPEYMFGEMTAEQLLLAGARRRGANMTEGVPVPSSEHVAEIVGRQGCKIKALRAKTNTYIKTPMRGEEPVFIVTGRKEDVEMAKREILAAAEHFSIIRASRNKISVIPGSTLGPPNLPGQTTIQVRVPYRVVGLVVGPKGATIKRIQQSTHTYIVTPSRDKEPVFEVSGMPENVDRAREEIEAHITMRTGSIIDFHPDNDFDSNGTDVCMDVLGRVAGSLWSKVPAPRRDSSGSRNDRSSLESPYFGTECREQCPESPFRSVLAGNFPLGGEANTGQPPVGMEDCEYGLDHLALDLNTPATFWSTIDASHGQLQNLNGSPAHRRNSGFSGCTTPLLSPTVPDNGIGLEHPLARRIHSDPVSSISWLPNQGSFSNSAGYSSSSSLPTSSSVASGSPTDSSSSEGHRKTGRDCVVCYESEVIAALVPCGHNLFCMECAIRICERVLPECPACHAPATQAIRIFS
ncbi:RNA-binding protein MEX3D [Anomaloglossus baeobatrachus]|uniref:RNA-binding protein MEX3D n=1 Tax=Anomaloglossus baeobatrachus TaxID=238106 RepID=UPI003F4FA091